MRSLFVYSLYCKKAFDCITTDAFEREKNSHIIKNWHIFEIFFSFFFFQTSDLDSLPRREEMTIIFNGVKSINSIVYPINIKFQLKTGWKWLFVTGIPVLVTKKKCNRCVRCRRFLILFVLVVKPCLKEGYLNTYHSLTSQNNDNPRIFSGAPSCRQIIFIEEKTAFFVEQIEAVT